MTNNSNIQAVDAEPTIDAVIPVAATASAFAILMTFVAVIAPAAMMMAA